MGSVAHLQHMPSLQERTAEIIDTAVRLHARLGPGLLESVYETVLMRSLQQRGLEVARQVQVSFEFDGMLFRNGLRIDLLIDQAIIIEIKSTETLSRVHMKQLLTYLKLMNLRVGLVLNFGAPTMKEGIRRVVNGYVPPS
jgi:GxxExxY protein